MNTLLQESLLSGVMTAILLIIPLWRIFARAGLRPALSLLIFIPFAGALICLLILALSRWPATERWRA